MTFAHGQPKLLFRIPEPELAQSNNISTIRDIDRGHHKQDGCIGFAHISDLRVLRMEYRLITTSFASMLTSEVTVNSR
ncbi:uncharacterized protein PITG_02676 [Phytophthora infestans T30-4]|uniref:Uncharacterized protein n=1 Tax=Phytophthora infestans (strain T30-4) TaxID=403677 RepID=D0MWY3_PHYIT|nr:uncharacterized protein PITG_02676 [Phytophthora infestans T30-4]EEY64146.1 hypothetical protein PITG_02676 [Phytophthora infestans T30-4]|eukprot:XP_002907582.1 hypothetical protein PITG_02676 [Phytophthora infestans T30-4]